MDDLTAAIADAARTGVAQALTDHTPRYAYSPAEVGEMLGGIHPDTVRRLATAGLLDRIPHTGGKITLGSIRRLAGLPDTPVSGLALVDDRAAS